MRTGELYQRYNGLYIATVVDIDDPSGLGRIRLKTDQYDDSSDDAIWASVSRPVAGKKNTVYFTPEVGDQVIIGYMTGDVHEPIVLGYAHSKKVPPPAPVNREAHGVVSSIGEVIFDEENKKITVKFSFDDSESSIVMNKDGIEIRGPKVLIQADKVEMNPGPSNGRVCINSQAIVLEPFMLEVFNQHVHFVVAPALPTSAAVSLVPPAGVSKIPSPIPGDPPVDIPPQPPEDVAGVKLPKIADLESLVPGVTTNC